MNTPDLDLRAFALTGARLELHRILEAFPELRTEVSPSAGADFDRRLDGHAAARAEAPAPEAGARRVISPEQRRLISRRMKAYWRRRRDARA